MEFTVEEATMVLQALNREFELLDEMRKHTPYPEDQPMIERQSAVADLMTQFRTTINEIKMYERTTGVFL